MLGEKQYQMHLFDDTTDGYIHLVRVNDDETTKSCSTKLDGLREVIRQVIGHNDTYITPNTTYKPGRYTSNIRQLRALYIDIDGAEGDQLYVCYSIYELAEKGEIPEPTMIINSGRGLHLYWKIKNAPYQALHTWQALEDNFYYKLRKYGADNKALDAVRVLRLPGTINSKNNKTCRVIAANDKLEYSMYDLREKYLKYKPKQLEFQETKKKANKKVVSNKFFNSYSLHTARAEDIETLCILRGYAVTGHRNMIIHCYAYWRGIIVRDSGELSKEVIDLNNAFTEPLKESQINAVLRCIPKAIDKFIKYENDVISGVKRRVTKGMRDKDGYWYKNETLIERLNITPEEQKHLKTIIGTEEKYRRRRKSDNEYQKAKQKAKYRNEEGLTKTELKRRNEFILIARMELQDMSLRAIAKEIGKSVSTISEKINKTYEKINYTEIKEEVANGCYDDVKVAI